MNVSRSPDGDFLPTRAILRVVIVVIASAVAVYLIYLVREPLGWLVLALFLAVAAAGPVAFLSRYMRKGFAVAITYVSIALAPFLIALVLVIPLVEQTADFVDSLPAYVDELHEELAPRTSLTDESRHAGRGKRRTE